ncbi:MAG: conjugal transfer transcriptional regulator TraJ [Rhodoferax sp.]
MSLNRLTRKGNTPICVWVTPDEKSQIKAIARTAGHSTSAYLRNIGLGYPVKSILDNKRVEELARINGDLGRLGGLLKLWLTDDRRTFLYGKATILAVLSKIEDTQDKMHDVMRAVVIPKTDQ